MWSYVNKNEKENRKKLKFLKLKKKNVLEIWWIGSCPQNLVCIHAGVSKKPEFTDEGRTTDDGHLHHDSNSADKVKQMKVSLNGHMWWVYL